MERIPFETLDLLNDSFNYETIRLLAVSLYSKGKHLGISERCRIFTNPVRHNILPYAYDEGWEKYFDFEKLDDTLSDVEAIQYKKCFVKAFNICRKNKKLVLY
ncbi:hypothetical protein ACILE9_10305 [Capnocytophaga cynodegmi]|uniref:hypothetical protein n=1 Tax=Capnocytophaga cynodegmi TaxID=28189 RepID=UPI0037D444E5